MSGVSLRAFQPFQVFLRHVVRLMVHAQLDEARERRWDVVRVAFFAFDWYQTKTFMIICVSIMSHGRSEYPSVILLMSLDLVPR